MHEPSLACPACRNPLQRTLECRRCGQVFAMHDGVPVLLMGAASSALEQAAWFDSGVDSEYEITRPRGTPKFHQWLLAQKFRRSVEGLDLNSATALSVCAGSGMDAEFLARAGARVTAVDVSAGAAARTAERAVRFGVDITPVVADVERLPFCDAAFELVYVHDGLHHLEDPYRGLSEMARVTRMAISITEPAQARITRAAVRLGVALEREEAGNRVARLDPSEIASALTSFGFRIVRAARYAMLYRHEPGLPSRALSLPVVFPLACAAVNAANATLGRFGNKLVVVAVRE